MAVLDTIVIENSADCNLRCPACPTVYAPDYPRKIMPMDLFEKILSHISTEYFSKCALMGWGEPLLDSTYFVKLNLLKKKGFFVGSTSNFTLLDSEKLEQLIENQLDYLALSIDSNHLKACNISESVIKQKLDRLLPFISDKAGYLKIGLNIIALNTDQPFIIRLLELFRNYPVSGVSISPLIMIPSLKLHKKLFSGEQLFDFKKSIDEKFPDMTISFQYLDDAPEANCRSDIFRNVYVNYRGEVSPCCVLAMAFPNVTFDGELRQTNLLTFGQLDNCSFDEIWMSDKYTFFRNIFKENKIPSQCMCCNSWRKL